ncbi:hypothetical protein [Niallia sp. RD1]|uniref:hypothetical protein n=1 Tax=Niallia sp. RD1 TaxID=2962858 RepID=UPI0020C1A89E|nr:hypothetical protein [Niallia sp. RD1]UTI44248.1 hypothetical protein NKG37_11850 [Niallia sp. RD1]
MKTKKAPAQGKSGVHQRQENQKATTQRKKRSSKEQKPKKPPHPPKPTIFNQLDSYIAHSKQRQTKQNSD